MFPVFESMRTSLIRKRSVLDIRARYQSFFEVPLDYLPQPCALYTSPDLRPQALGAET